MKYKYNISNLDCAACVLKIEEKLKKDKNIINAIVNFSSLKLTIETNMKGDVLKYVTKIVKSVEPGVDITDKKVKETNILSDIIRFAIGIILGILGFILPFNNLINTIFIICAYIILLSKTFVKAIKLLIKNRTLNENFLITISCIGAYLIDKKQEGLMVITLYEIGKMLEAIAVNNSRKQVASLMDIKPEYANVKYDSEIKVLNPEDVKIGDIIVVKMGEEIPLDGIIIKGEAKVNTSALTGESVLRSVKINDEVSSGMINEEGLLEIKVTTNYENSTVNKILELVENATDKKAKTENFVSKAAKIYTPLVFLFAVLFIVFGIILTNNSFSDLLYKSLTFLVISCPCAIAISVPLSYFAGIGASSKHGILIKGSDYLDSLRNIEKIVFDKTGTITTGVLKNIKINIMDKSYTEETLKQIIVSGEKLSNHPIAKSIVNLLDTNYIEIKDFKEHKGNGISFKVDKNDVLIGNYKFCSSKEDDALFYVNINGKLVASITVTDSIKKQAKETIESLKNKGITCEMFTGDRKASALEVAKDVGMDNVKYELLPNQKYELLDNYIKQNIFVAFVGDGINDAPTLALASIGISMGGVGSSSAVEASDIVIMNDELDKINTSIEISKYTNKIIKQNLIFALSTKVLVLILSIFGISSMWQAVFADVGVTLLTIINSMRILKK